MKNDLTGLPLFDWCIGRSSVLPFPPARRINLARTTAARLLAEKDGKALAEAVRLVKTDLRVAGISSDSSAWPYVWMFYEAVQAEVRRLDGTGSPLRGCR